MEEEKAKDSDIHASLHLTLCLCLYHCNMPTLLPLRYSVGYVVYVVPADKTRRGFRKQKSAS